MVVEVNEMSSGFGRPTTNKSQIHDFLKMVGEFIEELQVSISAGVVKIWVLDERLAEIIG